MVSGHQTKFWLVGLDSLPDWILAAQNYVRPKVIVRYLSIPFGVEISLVFIRDWFPQRS
jgi:hypothetical protein